MQTEPPRPAQVNLDAPLRLTAGASTGVRRRTPQTHPQSARSPPRVNLRFFKNSVDKGAGLPYKVSVRRRCGAHETELTPTMRKPLDCRLSGFQMTTLTCALQVAAQRYDENIKGLEDSKAKWDAMSPEAQTAHLATTPIFHPAALPSLIAQFKRQAKDARELLALVEQGPSEDDGEVEVIVRFTPDD